MEHLRFTTHSDEILCLVNQAALWVQSEEEHVLWSGTELPYRKTITEFTPHSQPFEVCALEIAAQLVGYLEVHQNQFGWVVARILVRPDYRRRGYCQKMLAAVLPRIFTKSNAVNMFVGFGNNNALRLYERLGFVRIGSYPEDGVDRLLLLKDQYFLISVKKLLAKPRRRSGSKLLGTLLTRMG